jgi:diaminopimelate decarboxylase
VSGVRKPPERPPGLTYSRLVLRGSPGLTFHCDQLPLDRLARRFGTPLYVYSASMICERLRRFEQSFRKVPHTICYSVKANSNLSILRLLAREGCGFDVVSGGELERVLRVTRGKAKNVVFSGVGKTPEEMRFALEAGILLFNVESASELSSLAECAVRAKKIARVALRANPDVPAKTHPYISTGLRQHKFGVPIREARRLYAKAAEMKSLTVTGVSVHIGSQISDVKPFAAAMERVAELVRELRADGHRIECVDAGGGLGIDYQQDSTLDFVEQLAGYADALLRPLRGLKIHLLLEPGRCIVGPAGVLLTRVIYKKTNGKKKFLIVDAAMNDLLRPSLYGAYHQIVPVELSRNQAHETVDVVGPVCETGDFLARDHKMRIVQEGDLLAILDAGAYGMVLASNYNTRPRPAEVLVDGRSAKLIRKRESVADLLRGEN